MAVEPLPLSDATHVRVASPAGERVVAIEELRRQLGVDALIRVHEADFALIPKQVRLLVHFNLEVTLNEAGRRYAVTPITRAGMRLPGGDEVLPAVDPSRARRCTCLKVAQRLPIKDVTAEQLASSLPNIRNADQLRAALLRRYKGMFPGLSDDEILSRGCAVTYLAFDD